MGSRFPEETNQEGLLCFCLGGSSEPSGAARCSHPGSPWRGSFAGAAGLLESGEVAVGQLPLTGTSTLWLLKTLSAASPETTAGRQTQVKTPSAGGAVGNNR